MQTHEGTKLLTDGFPWSMNALAYWSTRKRQCKQRLGQEGSQQIEKQKGRPWMKITESVPRFPVAPKDQVVKGVDLEQW